MRFLTDIKDRARRAMLTKLHANWWQQQLTFSFCGESFPLFSHRHNCGWPPGRMTERAVELSLADRWLSMRSAKTVLEVGAVTPYYWPGRVPLIIDPTDDSPWVSHRMSVLDIPLSTHSVLSISTFEHIGTGDYAQSCQPELLAIAFEKLFAESPTFLLTIPMGYSAHADAIVLNSQLIPADVSVYFLTRSSLGNDWHQVDSMQRANVHYGRGSKPSRWANTVVVLQR